MSAFLSKLKWLIILPVVIVACKKDDSEPVATTPLVPTVTEEIAAGNAIKDSTFLMTKDIYLWNTQLPATFNARNFADPEKIMEGIRPYSVVAGFTNPVDRFSFAMKKTEWDAMSAGISSATANTTTEGDKGITVLFRSENDLRVRLVEPNSPAHRAGIRRGWRITRVNGSENISTTNADFLVNNIYESPSVSLTFRKPDGSTADISLSSAKYSTQPVYLDTILNLNNRTVGYLVFTSFLGNTDAIFQDLGRVFNKFESAQISDIIIDLRYNGGGYVTVQERLANYLVKANANGSVMMTQAFNAINSRQNKTTLFKKQGSLHVDRIYFIVSRATASASELLINNLKPYMNVELVGNTTYGKPVGYFPIPVGDWYIFPVSFKTTNRDGASDYFNGLNVNHRVADGLDKDWGDITESGLAAVIRNISSGSYRLGRPEQPFEESLTISSGNKKLELPFLKLTIDSPGQ